MCITLLLQLAEKSCSSVRVECFGACLALVCQGGVVRVVVRKHFLPCNATTLYRDKKCCSHWLPDLIVEQTKQ